MFNRFRNRRRERKLRERLQGNPFYNRRPWSRKDNFEESPNDRESYRSQRGYDHEPYENWASRESVSGRYDYDYPEYRRGGSGQEESYYRSDEDLAQRYGRQTDFDYDRQYDRRDHDWDNSESYHEDDDEMRHERERRRNRDFDHGNYGSYNRNSYGRNYSARNFASDEYQDRFNRNQHLARRYPTAGMNSDYDADRYRHSRRDRGEGYDDSIGYDPEGAFYQDLDNTYSYNYRDAGDLDSDRRNFRGIGPSGYKRSNERIFEEVAERLTEHGYIDASDIEVFVENNVVVLRGSVPSRHMKRLAEDVADNVSGVSDVQNELRVHERGEGLERSSSRQRQSSYERDENMNREKFEEHESSPRNIPTTGNVVPGSLTSDTIRDEAEQRKGVREGMEVISRDGKSIGAVKEIHDDVFLVDREMARDLYIPFASVQSVGEQVMLSVAYGDIDSQDWKSPPVIG